MPNAQESAIRTLDDPDPDLVVDSLVALSRWGSAEAEAALWARLKRFHQEWAEREDQLRATPDFKSEASQAVALQQSLVSALATGAGWICPPDKLALLAALVSTKAQKQQIDGWIKAWSQTPTVIDPTWFPEDSPTFSVLQYSALTEKQLAAKLVQFPEGTQLQWQFWKPAETVPGITMALQEAAYERVRSVAESTASRWAR